MICLYGKNTLSVFGIRDNNNNMVTVLLQNSLSSDILYSGSWLYCHLPKCTKLKDLAQELCTVSLVQLTLWFRS